MLIQKHCHDRMFYSETNIEVIFALIETVLAPSLPKTYVRDIGKIVQDAANLVAAGKLSAEGQWEYVITATKEYLETSKK